MKEPQVDAAQVGKMFVTGVSFQWHRADSRYDEDARKSVPIPGHWEITASLSEDPNRYSSKNTMTLEVEHGIGAKLAEVLLPVIIADASRKAQQLADDSKAMLTALGDRALTCIANMPTPEK